MLTIEKTVLMSPEQMQMIIEGMRNPKNSWDRSDSAIEHIEDPETMQTADWQFHLGDQMIGSNPVLKDAWEILQNDNHG